MSSECGDMGTDGGPAAHDLSDAMWRIAADAVMLVTEQTRAIANAAALVPAAAASAERCAVRLRVLADSMYDCADEVEVQLAATRLRDDLRRARGQGGAGRASRRDEFDAIVAPLRAEAATE